MFFRCLITVTNCIFLSPSNILYLLRIFKKHLLSAFLVQNYLKHFCLETLESRKFKLDYILLYKLIYGFYELDVSNFITPSDIQVKIFGRFIMNNSTVIFDVKTWNELPYLVVTSFNTRNFKNHLDSGEVSKIIDKNVASFFQRSSTWW